MKPVAILQHEASQGPGILLDHLRQQDIAHVLLDPCAQGSVPADARDYRGIIVLGSNHCANEQLRWIDDERCLLQSAQQLMDLPTQATLFNWHYDTFEIPQVATRTMYGQHCLNKGFAHGRHWAFQGHLEVTEASVRQWCCDGHEELLQAQGPAVQSKTQIPAQLPRHIAALHTLALRTYSAWTASLDRPVSVPVAASTFDKIRLKSSDYLRMTL